MVGGNVPPRHPSQKMRTALMRRLGRKRFRHEENHPSAGQTPLRRPPPRFKGTKQVKSLNQRV